MPGFELSTHSSKVEKSLNPKENQNLITPTRVRVQSPHSMPVIEAPKRPLKQYDPSIAEEIDAMAMRPDFTFSSDEIEEGQQGEPVVAPKAAQDGATEEEVANVDR